MIDAWKWIGTIAQVVGVFLLSTKFCEPVGAFGVMLIGSAAWVVAATLAREWSALTLNAAFTLSNIIGIWRWAQ